MNIFKSKELIDEDQPDEAIDPLVPSPVTQSVVLDYMLDLKDEEYDKLLKVAKVYRDANKKASDILGAELDELDKPVGNTADLNEDEIDSILNDDLDASEFIESNPKTAAKSK